MALATTGFAAALGLLCVAVLARRSATCTVEPPADDGAAAFYQDWRPFSGTSPELDRVLGLPAVATATLLASRRDWLPFVEAGPGWPHAGTRVYGLGPFQLRARYWEGSFVQDFTVEDPRSCRREDLTTFSNIVGGPATLREDKDNGGYAITFLDADKNAALVFRRASGPFRWPLGALALGAGLCAIAIHTLLRAGRYFRKGGLADWRAGRFAEDGLIEPDDGGERVRPGVAADSPCDPVLFVEGVPNVATYRTAGERIAARTCSGSREDLRAQHARFARFATAFSAMACVTFAAEILAWLK